MDTPNNEALEIACELENSQLRLFKIENPLGTEHIGFERTESGPLATQVETELLKLLKPTCNRAGVKPDKFFDWTIREMPRSWRLEIHIQETSGKNTGFRSTPRFFSVHGALLRQLHGLTRGHFSLMELPTTLLKGPAALSGVYEDRDMCAELAGPAPEDKRTFNHGLRDTARLFLDGIEPWPEFPCPLDDRKVPDRWSVDLWEKDQADLKEAFEDFVQPHRMKQFGFKPEDFSAGAT